jgi:hypothetical protein
MSEQAPDPIPYARPIADDPRLTYWLRRTVGWAAAVYGAATAVAMVYFIMLSRKWFVAPIDFGRFTRAQDVVAWAEVAAHLLLAPAGVMVLRAGAGVPCPPSASPPAPSWSPGMPSRPTTSWSSVRSASSSPTTCSTASSGARSCRHC